MFNNFFNIFILILSASTAKAETAVPLNESAWVVLSYNKIPANKVIFSSDKLTVKVKNSAGPIVHKLEKISKISEFFIKGKITGSKANETTAFEEDSMLRFGLVAIGNQTLSGPKKWFAADWVKKLFALAPEGIGLDKIYFYNFTQQSEFLGKSRAHPKSDLIVENIFAEVKPDGTFSAQKKIDPPIESTAIWISIDGDDTQSEYETEILEIKLNSTQ